MTDDKEVMYPLERRKVGTHVKGKIKLSPLLLLYTLYILLASKALTPEDALGFDQARYIRSATNPSHGYYSPRSYIDLWNGPGYPIVLLPFVLMGTLSLPARLLNAVFLFGAIFCLYSTLRFYVSERLSLLVSYLLGIYPPFFVRLHLLLTETLAVLLICGFVFYYCRLNQEEILV